MLQQQTIGPSGQVQVVVEDRSDLTFDPQLAVSGIVFHLLDGKLARKVAPDTVRRTIERLQSKSFSAKLPRTKWRLMTHSQRLDWLLRESQTLTLMGDDETAMLRARRSR